MVALCATTLLCLLLAQPAAARRSRCSARQAVVKTSTVLVYKKRKAHASTAGLYVCSRPNGRSHLIGQVGPAASLLKVQVAGDYVAAQLSLGQSLQDCLNQRPDSGSQLLCQAPPTVIDVVTASRGRTAAFHPVAASGGASDTPVPGCLPAPVEMAVSPAGAVAWVDCSGLSATRLSPLGSSRLRGRPTVLEANPKMTGTGPSGPLSFTGLTVHWLEHQDGMSVARSAPAPG